MMVQLTHKPMGCPSSHLPHSPVGWAALPPTSLTHQSDGLPFPPPYSLTHQSDGLPFPPPHSLTHQSDGLPFPPPHSLTHQSDGLPFFSLHRVVHNDVKDDHKHSHCISNYLKRTLTKQPTETVVGTKNWVGCEVGGGGRRGERGREGKGERGGREREDIICIEDHLSKLPTEGKGEVNYYHEALRPKEGLLR